MKGLLFMYPIYEYFLWNISCRGSYNELLKRSYKLENLNNILEQRYRSKGFGVSFTLFSDKEVYEKILVKQTDTIFYTNVTFEQMKNKEYADPKDLLRQVPYDELFLGGFHQSDCVERIAQEAYNEGRKVFIDEDVTDVWIFSQPDPLANFSSESRKFELECNKIHHLLTQDFKERRNKPWYITSSTT